MKILILSTFAILGSFATACHSVDASVCPAKMPAAINPPADETIKSSYEAIGNQIYVCAQNSGTWAWNLVGPQSNLYDEKHKLVATHYVGPTWQANDGSSVAGTKTGSVSVDGSAIPWMILKGSSKVEDGELHDVTSIQRVKTTGGLPPGGCDAEHAGAVAQAPYTAQYVFYKTKSGDKVEQCKGQ